MTNTTDSDYNFADMVIAAIHETDELWQKIMEIRRQREEKAIRQKQEASRKFFQQIGE